LIFLVTFNIISFIYTYNVPSIFKINTILFSLVWNTVRSNYNDVDEYYDNEFTGAKYYIYSSFKGVSLIVSLTNGTVIYCMGFLVTDENIRKEEQHAYRYVLTSAGCIKHNNFNNVRVRIIIIIIEYVLRMLSWTTF